MTGRFSSRASLVTLGLLLAGGILACIRMGPDFGRLANPAEAYDFRYILLLYSSLPRLVTALVAGAALALAGTLLQQALRNPIASPTTLGISAGANLALVAAILAFPELEGVGRDAIALTGSAAAAAVIFMIGARRGFSPFALVLSGLIVSVWCGALSGILMLLNDRYMSGLFIWGAGSLSQQSWTIPLSLLPKVAALTILSFFMVRPLSLMELGDSGASGLGLSIKRVRIIVVCLAIALAALVTSAVGVIGFVGLIAPGIARLAGARHLKSQIVWSPLIGAGLLLLTDEMVQILDRELSLFLPTGALTALLGGPLLLIMLPRLRKIHRNLPTGSIPGSLFAGQLRAITVIACICLAALLLAVILLGRDPTGNWNILDFARWPDVLPYRLPRVIGAFTAGIMLGLSGTILQRLTGNEMASPEVLGISAGATAGVAVCLFVLASPGIAAQVGFAAVGAFSILLAIFFLGIRSGFAPERVLLAGIALGAMLDAAIGILAAGGDPRAMKLMQWMGGSTYLIEFPTAFTATVVAILGMAGALASYRWLDMLPLGPVAARAAGIRVGVARAVLFVLAAALAAAATLTVGPLSFIGLMGPHVARELGLRRAMQQLVGAALAGGGLLVLADWFGRMLAFPYQIPAGLVSALVGTPLLLILLLRR